jgi:outer membrane protein assembly factor BamB
MSKRYPPVILLIALAVLFLCATDTVAQNNQPHHPLWDQAQLSYIADDRESGNQYLKQLIEQTPGDTELAITCLDLILRQEGATNYTNPWVKFAAQRLMALEHAGQLSANTFAAHSASKAAADIAISQGYLIEAIAELDRLASENADDLHYPLLRARAYRKLGFPQTRQLYASLKKRIDANHPDVRIRELSYHNWQEFNTPEKQLPLPIVSPPKGSPISLMEPDDPDGLWQLLVAQGPSKNARSIDRLAAKTIATDDIVPWRDMSGLINPSRALDIHLTSLPAKELEALRQLQTRRFASEQEDAGASLDETFALTRRFPWATQSQTLLLKLANKAIWKGHANSALRSYEQVLRHSAATKVLEEAQVGYWLALAQISKRERLEKAFHKTSPHVKIKSYPWMGKPTAVEAIQASILKTVPNRVPVKSHDLASLAWQVVQIPPVSPWSSNVQIMPISIDLQFMGNDLLVAGRNLLAMYDAEQPNSPRWTQVQHHHLDDRNYRDFLPGYFRPTINKDILYTRWGYTGYPRGIAAIDRQTGQPLWTNERPYPDYDKTRRRMFSVPIGDVQFADNLMYYLQWTSRDDLRRTNGRRLSLTCFDTATKTQRWDRTIAEAGTSTDLNARFERAFYQTAIYGNRVTVHEGSVYSCSNAGVVARSDIRDGKTDWVHFYSKSAARRDAQQLGAPPVAIEDKVIFMPRDSMHIFALDQRTGRVVWKNVLATPNESLGIVNDLLIVRGQTSLVALEHATGEIRWYLPLPSQSLQRAQLIGDSIYHGSATGLQRIDANSGKLLEETDWPKQSESVVSFRINQKKVYIVTDAPAEDPQQVTGTPLNPRAPQTHANPGKQLSFPLKTTWSIPRNDAHLTIPPAASGITNKAFILSDGLLECLEMTPKGAINWRKFIAFHDAQYHFHNQKLILFERNKQITATSVTRIASFDISTGKVNWRLRLPYRLEHAQQCGSVILFSNSRGWAIGVDAEAGKQLWARQFGIGNSTIVRAIGDTVHVFKSAQLGVPKHFVINSRSGNITNTFSVAIQAAGKSAHGKLIKDGFIEVSTPQHKARYIRFVALSEVNGRGWASGAELHIIGKDSKNINRDNWQIKASNWERKADSAPRKLIDGDPSTWWHSEWKDHIPGHPHTIEIDMGKSETITGLRYLPAIIVNNNGTIRDYQFSISQDGKNWGQPIAQGMMIPSIRIERPIFVGKFIFFETRNLKDNTYSVYKYALDGQRAKVAMANARIISAASPYLAITKYNRPNPDTFMLLHSENDKYQMDLGKQVHFNRSKGLNIKNDRLVISERGIMIADLAKKHIVLPYTNNNKDHNRHGISAMVGKDHLLKFVPAGHLGCLLYLVDLRTGKITNSKLPAQTEAFKDIVNLKTPDKWQRGTEMLLVYDGWNVQAVINAPNP